METFKVVRLHNENGKRASRVEEARVADLDAGEVVIRARYAAVNYKDARAVTEIGRAHV